LIGIIFVHTVAEGYVTPAREMSSFCEDGPGTLDHVKRTILAFWSLPVVGALVIAACASATSDVSSTAPTPVVSSTAVVSPTTVVDDGLPTIPDGFDVEGHRGARGLKPENTLPAFETALDLGVTTLEFDLHFSADGEIVVWHDPVIDPDKCGLKQDAPAGIPDPDAADTPEDTLAIRSLTVEELEWFQCNRNPDTVAFPDQDPAPTTLAGDEYGIMSLNDLFDFVDRYAGSDSKTEQQRNGAAVVQFNMETKRDRGNPSTIGDGFDGETVGPFEQRILELIDERGLGDRVIIQSFDVRSLQAIDVADPEIRLAVLTAIGNAALPAFVADRTVIWSPRASTVDAASIAGAHEAGHTVIPWTVSDPEEIARLVAAGVDGLITDRPDLFADR
jgi:glycerophosphoryl diester phosphodiesterase